MQTITHEINFDVSAQELFDALTQEAHIKEWWTNTCKVPAGEGVLAQFLWGNYGWAVEMQIVKAKPDQIVWKCTKSNMQNTAAWVGTTLQFDIREEGPKKTVLSFAQGPYPESSCYDVCREGWNFFLSKSLKNYLERGQGSPYRE